MSLTPHRATILVACGDFGRDVLRRFLGSAALRGVLRWEEAARLGERRLQDLALLYVPDRRAEGRDNEADRDEEATRMVWMRDLYRQIRPVGPGTASGEEMGHLLAAVVEEESDRLRTRGVGREHALPSGLDLLVIAQPADDEAVGRLDRVVTPALERLAGNPVLSAGVGSSASLSFLEILDFDRYWQQSEHARQLRRAVVNSIREWHSRRGRGQAAFGRIYLVDGETLDGRREARMRMDEISVFLEFLLFEAQQGGELPDLYRAPREQKSVVAAFGIRAMERSAGRLTRLAVAVFGEAWLEHLISGGKREPARDRSALRGLLADYRPGEFEDEADTVDLERGLTAGMAEVERDFLGQQLESPGWPGALRRVWAEKTAPLRARLTESATQRMSRVRSERLPNLAEKLRTAIDSDLSRLEDPLALNDVLEEVDRARAELAVGEEGGAAGGTPAGDRFADLDRFHSSFQRFRRERIHPERVRRWWLLLTLVLTLGLTPLVSDVLSSVPAPDPAASHHLVVRLHGVLAWRGAPLLVALLLFASIFLVVRFGFHRQLAARVERALSFFTDPERGRVAQRVRAALGRRGALGGPAYRWLAGANLDLTLNLRSEVVRELARVADRLGARREEMNWLRRQLGDFLRIHGLGDGRVDWLAPGREEETGIRFAMETGRDLKSLLAHYPANENRFRSLQVEAQPFEGDQKYCDAFLYPLQFVDRLSREFQDALEKELEKAAEERGQAIAEEDFEDYLRKVGRFEVGMAERAHEALSEARPYCVLPRAWRRISGIERMLRGWGVPNDQILEGSGAPRAWLLVVRAGFQPEALEDAP